MNFTKKNPEHQLVFGSLLLIAVWFYIWRLTVNSFDYL